MLKLKLTKDDWDRVAVTSDTHIGHKNIVLGCSNWDEPEKHCRDFKHVDEHDQYIIDGINSTVPKDGILVHLGDWSFAGINNIWRFRSALQVKEVHLIMGNHDRYIRNNKDNCQAAFTSVNEKGLIQIEDQTIILDHYPQRVWWGSHRGNWMLHGHSHSNLEYGEYMKYKTMDVGVDNHPEYRPFLLSEIKTIMDKRVIIVKDHHR